MAASNTEKVQLKRVIGTIDIFAVSVATVISGVYFGWNYGLGIAGPFGFLMAILFSFIFYGFVLMCDSELGSTLAKTGGEYLFAERAMGGMAGTITAAFILLTSITGLSSVAMGFASYIYSISGILNESLIAIISIAIVMILAILNIKFSSKVQLIITGLTILVIAIFIVISGINNQGVTMYTSPVAFQGGFLGFLIAIPFGMWFFIGCDTTIGLTEELKNPGKSLPRGFLLSILTLLVVALLVWWASTGVMPWEELGTTDAPIITAIWNFAPPAVITLINIASIASLFGTLLGLMLYSSRILFAVARDGYLPRPFGFLQSKFASPYMSVIILGVISMILCFFSNLSRMVAAASGSALGIYIMVALSVIFLRKKEPELDRPYKIKGWLFPLIPILIIAMSLLVFSSYIFSDPVTFYVFVGVALFGILYYLLIGKRKKKNSISSLKEKEE